MFKKIILIITTIILIGGIGYVLIPKEEKENNPNTVSDKIENSKSNTKTKIESLTLLTNGQLNHSKNGYYYINMEEVSNIKYFDYAAKKEIYLCNKPNCNHRTQDCSSFIEIMGESKIFVYNNNLYLISSAAVTKQMDTGGNSGFMMESIEQTAPTIYKMNLDGANKTKQFECPSGTKMIPCIIAEDTLYAFFTKSKNVSTGTNSITQMETERKLVKINLKTGKYEELADSKNQTVLGIYKNSVVLEEIEYLQDPEKFLKNDTGDINNLRNSTKIIKLFNLDTKQETEIYKDIYKNMETISFTGNQVYFIGSNSKKLEYVNVETKEKGTLVDLPKARATFQGIYDNKLQYLYYNSSSDTGKLDSAYYIDLETKETKKFNLWDSNGILVEILAENDEYYFVRTGYELTEEYTTWAGTKQRNIKKTNYGLIKKEDYWNSRANYIPMKNTDN